MKYSAAKASRSLARGNRRRYRKSVKSSKKSLVKTIKRVIHQQVENKYSGDYQANQSIGTATTTLPPKWFSLAPFPTQGTSVQQRLGNTIRVVKATCKGYVNLLPYNATTNPQPSSVYVKMWLCRRRNNQLNTTPTQTDFNNFFSNGSTNIGFQGTMLDMCLRNNSEYWTVLKTKTVQLQNFFCNGTTGVTVLGNSGQNSMPFSFDVTKYLGLCKYNDTATNPQNKELILVFQAVNADGSSIAIQSLAEYHMAIEWQFEDA